jgi:hypothetical protein
MLMKQVGELEQVLYTVYAVDGLILVLPHIAAVH